MISQLAVHLGQLALRYRFPPPRQHWQQRVWDGDRAEAHAELGLPYREQREIVTALLAECLHPQRGPVRAADVACGTGRYTRALLKAGADHVTAMDISARSLAKTAERAAAPGRVDTWLGDILTEQPASAPFHLVLCCDAIHHLGDLRRVLERLRALTQPGGVIVGDIWTADHFHEFQRRRRGPLEHTVSSLRFFSASIVNAVTGRPVLQAARSQLLSADQVERVLRVVLGPDLTVHKGRYWVSFLCRVGVAGQVVSDHRKGSCDAGAARIEPPLDVDTEGPSGRTQPVVPA